MATLVLGNAAHLDLILRSDRRPGDSDFGMLLETPGSQGRWCEGGATFTIALMLARLGTQTMVWHPIPGSRANDEIGLDDMRHDGVDLLPCPHYDGDAVRSIMVYGDVWRLGWSSPPATAEFSSAAMSWDDIDSLVIAPIWGDWTEQALAEAQGRNAQITLVGFSDPRAQKFRWDRIIVDEEQAKALEGVSASEWVITNGDKGARVLRDQVEIANVKAHPAKVVDTTGAGDTFAGAYLSAVSNGLDIETAIEQAVKYAARVCETWGSRPPRAFFGI